MVERRAKFPESDDPEEHVDVLFPNNIYQFEKLPGPSGLVA